MQSSLLSPRVLTLHASAQETTTGNGTVFDLPIADSYAFYLDVTAAGTTMDLAIQISVDSGTTFYTAARFAQVGASAAVRRLQIQGQMGRGEAGTESAIADTGGALNANTILTRKIRPRWTLSGNYTFALYCICIPRTTAPI